MGTSHSSCLKLNLLHTPNISHIPLFKMHQRLPNYWKESDLGLPSYNSHIHELVIFYIPNISCGPLLLTTKASDKTDLLVACKKNSCLPSILSTLLPKWLLKKGFWDTSLFHEQAPFVLVLLSRMDYLSSLARPLPSSLQEAAQTCVFHEASFPS